MAIPESGSIECHWIGVDAEKNPERAEMIAIAVENCRYVMLLNEFLSEFTIEEKNDLKVRLDRDRNALFFDFATVSDTLDYFHPILLKLWDAIGKNLELLNVADMAYFQANYGTYSEGYSLRWGDPSDLRHNWGKSNKSDEH